VRNTYCLLLGYDCKPVLESSDENIYLIKKERRTRIQNKTVLKM
jgi:hypothetical protein